jgi:excisionase family DNA binding protein
MAGMFYSLKEAAQRLGVAEDQVKQLAKDGKLREFRDGSNLLFKIDEVNALLAEGVDLTSDELELQEVSAEEPAQDLGDTAAAGVGEAGNEDIFKLDEEGTGALEATGEAAELSDSDLLPELQGLEAAETEPEEPNEEAPELELEEPQPAEQAAEEDLFLAEELSQPAGEEAEQPVADEAEGSSEEISLAQESGILAEGSDISDADTAITTEGINVLSETDTGYDVTEDSMAETAGPAATADTSGEASLEEIEDDVNLDSFGSGSGLLDLSLQADDTSLGGILDEIYTSEGGEGDATPAEGEPAEIGAEVGEGASFEEITAEADHAGGAEEEIAVPEPAAVMPAAMVPAYAEAAPDAQSNILGMLLFLPMLALLYTAIVTVSAMREVVPSILSSVQGLIWYIMGGGVVLALVMVGISFTAGREKAPRAARPVKDKKAKPDKSRKEAPKAEAKPAKEKKSLFGKKKEKK